MGPTSSLDGFHVESRDNPKTNKKLMQFQGFMKFGSTKTVSIFHLFSCAMLEAALKRTKSLPRRSWDAPRTLQDAPGRLLDSVWGGTWGLLGPSWAPRRPQDATKTYPRAAQNTSQDALGSQNRPDTQNRSKMKPRTPQNRAPNLVGKLQNRAKGEGEGVPYRR